MPYLAFNRLCTRQTPERGSLSRALPKLRDATTCPLLSLPLEVRLLIWQHLLDQVSYVFDFANENLESICYVPWHDRKYITFLHTCRLAYAEGLSLVKPRQITVRERDTGTGNGSKNVMAVPPRFTSFPLAFNSIRHNVTDLTIDAKFVERLIQQNVLLYEMPKLEHINITHEMQGVDLTHDDDLTWLKQTNRQKKFIDGILSDSINHVWAVRDLRYTHTYDDTHMYDHIVNSLRAVLSVPSLKPYGEITVRVRVVSSREGAESDLAREPPYFPIYNQINQIRIAFRWPSQSIVSLEVDLYDQVMEHAIRSQWTERIAVGELHAPRTVSDMLGDD